ncbi:MAG: D-alanine--D-alanine ligase [Bacteroidales bacterium]|nr:D-alanine--D-alanine ligase [Bacteroidales bacterium]
MKKNIAVIAGGYTGEADISLQGAENIIKYLDTEKYIPYLINIDKKNWFYLNKEEKIFIDKNDFSLNIKKKKIKFHCVFNIIHGAPGEDGKIQGYFDMLGIPYISSGLLSSAITFNKYFTTIIAANFKISTPKTVLIRKNEKIDTKAIIKKLSLPCFIKPNNSGSSIGMSKIDKENQLTQAINKAFTVDNEVLVQECIVGTEVTCGVFKNKGIIKTLPITEIISKRKFFDYTAKYKGKSQEITPAGIDKKAEKKCREISGFLYKEFNCKGVVRIDYILRENEFYLLEINSVPGMSDASIIPQQAGYDGISLKELYNILIEEAFLS